MISKPALPLIIWMLAANVAYAEEVSQQNTEVFFGVSDGRMQPGRFNNHFYEDKERGWFWYEDPMDDIDEDVIEQPLPEPPIAKEKPIPSPQQTAHPEAKPLSTEWFRKNMEKYRDTAIDNPTESNVSMYMYLQRVMLDKAEKFSEVSQRVVMADPILDENSRRPIATFGAFAMDDRAKKGTDKAAKILAEKAGFWFFYSSDCEFCLKEAGVLKGIMNTYGFKVLAIALDGLPLPDGYFPNFTNDQGQAKSMGVDMTPALFLVRPGKAGGAIQIGQGLLSGTEIIERTITLAHHNGWLNNDEYNNTLKVKPVQADTQTIQNIDERTVRDSNELVNTIRNNLRNQL